MALGLEPEWEDSSNPPPAESLEMMLLKGSLTDQERERRKRAQQRLKEVYSSIPWYKAQGEKDGDRFWANLHASAVLSN